MGGKGDFDISGGGGADPRDDYTFMADVLPEDFPFFEDGAGEIEELHTSGDDQNVDHDGTYYYFDSIYTFNDFPGTDGFFGFSDDSHYGFTQRQANLIDITALGDWYVDYSSNRVYSWGGESPSDGSYVHICEAQSAYLSSGPLVLDETRINVLGMLNDDITDETNDDAGGTPAVPGSTMARNLVGVRGWWPANPDPSNVLGFFYTWPARGSPIDHEGFYSSPNGGATWSKSTTIVDHWVIFTNYVVGDLVTSGGNVYRCILGHVGFQPPNATYWVVDDYWIPDFGGESRWDKKAAGVHIGNGIPWAQEVYGEGAGTILTAANLNQGFAVHMSNIGEWIYTSNDKGASWRRYSLKDVLDVSPIDGSNNVYSEKYTACRHPEVAATDPVRVALASGNFFVFILGNKHAGGPGGSTGIHAPADLIEVVGAHLGEDGTFHRVNCSVGHEAIEKCIATWEEDTNIKYMQAWHIGENQTGGYTYQVCQFSNSGGIGFTEFRWRDKFSSQTEGVDWWMEHCYSPDSINSYAIIRKASGSPLDNYFWRSLDHGNTWTKMGIISDPTNPTLQLWFRWFIILDYPPKVPAQRILAFADQFSGTDKYVWFLSEDGGVTWAELGRNEDFPLDDRWLYGDSDLPCGISRPGNAPPQVTGQDEKNMTYNAFDPGTTNDTAGGFEGCADAEDYFGKGAYLEWIIAGSILDNYAICAADAGFIIREDHVNGLRRKLLQLNSRVQTSGTNHVNFGIDVSDLVSVQADKTAVRANHYSILKREFDSVAGQVGIGPGTAFYTTGDDLVDIMAEAESPIADGETAPSIRTLIAMRKVIQALYTDGMFCACYSYCPCQTHFEFSGGGGKK
jgi:hypothetical protein